MKRIRLPEFLEPKKRRKDEPKRKRGQPTGYTQEYCQQVIRFGSEGKSYAQIAAKLGFTRVTLWNWTEKHPEFKAAMEESRERAMAWWEDKGQQCLTNRNFQSTSYIFAMKNRFRDDYYDQQVITGMNGQPLTSTPPPLIINFVAPRKGDDAKLIEAKASRD